MKQLLFIMMLICIVTPDLFSQASEDTNKDSVAAAKIYFPVRLYSDSVAFEKEMPKLAEQVLAGYKIKKKRTYFDEASTYYLLTGNYQKAIDFVDSVQLIDDNNAYGIDYKSYAFAKRAGDKNFESNFKKYFIAQFTPLSFKKKVYQASLDSATINGINTDYWDFKAKLKKGDSDSLSMEDAKSLVEKYGFYKIYDEIYPLMKPIIGVKDYQSMFPAIKSYKWGGVVPVKDIDELPDANMQYKLLMELTSFAYKGQDSTAKKEVNGGLGEVARLINLHEAAGIPRKNINVVVVVHAAAIRALLNNDKYKKKYGVNNPNVEIIKELQNYGAKIIVCGQAMTFLRIEKEDLLPGIKQALTAQTVLSTYQSKNYVYYDLSLRE